VAANAILVPSGDHEGPPVTKKSASVNHVTVPPPSLIVAIAGAVSSS
jgi:hypothetical protein